jgi:hypothetical protein
MGVGGTQVARAHAFALTDRTVGESSQLWSLASSPRVVGDRDVRPVGLQFSRRRCAIPFGPHDQSPAEPGEIRVLDHSGQSERAPRFIVFSHRPELVEGSPGTPSPQTRPGRRPVRPAVKASSWLMAQRTGTGWPAGHHLLGPGPPAWTHRQSGEPGAAVPTTVATPIVKPARHQTVSSGRTSRMRHHLQQFREGRQRVPCH